MDDLTVDGETVMTIPEFMAWWYPNVHLTPAQLAELDEKVAAVIRPANAKGGGKSESVQSAREHATDERASDSSD